MKTTCSLFVLAAATCLMSCAHRDPTAITIDTGALHGSSANGVLSWKGIPFAKPPVGPLRWRAPQAPTPWQGVRDATAYGHDCMQVPFPSDAAPLGTPPAEDCLYVNAWRPAGDATKLPVIFWIYGGGFVNGGSSPAVYDGSRFAEQGLVNSYYKRVCGCEIRHLQNQLS